jgi:putative hydrolase of the HAD superfamily
MAGERSRTRPEIVSACRRLRACMPTALLTNNIREWREMWRKRLPVSELFDFIVDSSDVGMRKPELPIYRLVERQMGLAGEELLFVDDLGVNLKAARQLGWQTVKYDDTARVLGILDAVLAGRVPR